MPIHHLNIRFVMASLLACGLGLLNGCGSLQAHQEHGLGRTMPFAGTVRAVTNLERSADARRTSAELIVRSADIGICLLADFVFLPIDAIASQMRAGHFQLHVGH